MREARLANDEQEREDRLSNRRNKADFRSSSSPPAMMRPRQFPLKSVTEEFQHLVHACAGKGERGTHIAPESAKMFRLLACVSLLGYIQTMR